MNARPAVPGNDSSGSGFEGFTNKEESTGKAIFHPKHGVQAAGAQGQGSTPGFTKRTPSVTKRSFLKKIGD